MEPNKIEVPNIPLLKVKYLKGNNKRKRRFLNSQSNHQVCGAFSEAKVKSHSLLRADNQNLLLSQPTLKVKAPTQLNCSKRWGQNQENKNKEIKEMSSKFFKDSLARVFWISRTSLQSYFQVFLQRWEQIKQTPGWRWKRSLFRILFRAILRS